MAIEDLIAFQKTYDFFVWQKTVVRHLAKVHKYSLGIQLENETVNLLKQIIRSNMSRDGREKEIVECLTILEMIKILIRAGHEYNKEGGISFPHYKAASEKLIEIGRLLGAWRKKF
ncbi:MAG: four helix bundle protein [Candidatus Wolfebacteria bacterium]|nr:four helix bundle protein [Candidatus Wolfebacteria bacterium]